MLYLYLDESGDLGFDFVTKKPSKFFTVTILAVSEDNKHFSKAVKKTLARKLNPKKKRKRIVQELKATQTDTVIKEYFYKQVADLNFSLYSVSLNKRRAYEKLTKVKSRVYNFIARQVIDRIPLEKATTRVELVVDKSKSKPEIDDFNNYIITQLKGRLDLKILLDIYHRKSTESPGLQAADLFCWGIFQVHERKKEEWFKIFKKKVKLNMIYLGDKRK